MLLKIGSLSNFALNQTLNNMQKSAYPEAILCHSQGIRQNSALPAQQVLPRRPPPPTSPGSLILRIAGADITMDAGSALCAAQDALHFYGGRPKSIRLALRDKHPVEPARSREARLLALAQAIHLPRRRRRTPRHPPGIGSSGTPEANPETPAHTAAAGSADPAAPAPRGL